MGCVVGITTPEQAADIYNFWAHEDDIQYQRCVCPEGWGGVACEIRKVECGDHHCFHGSTCVALEKPDGSVKHHCDCSTAGVAVSAYAGRFCQYGATSYCDPAQDHNGQQFCVNGGTCRDDPSEGCQCPQGYSGFKCEFRHEDTSVTTPPPPSRPNSRPVFDD